MQKKALLYSGKVKSLYETDDPNLLLAEFRDDTTAFDGEKHEKLDRKGMVNNLISAFIMEVLADSGVPTHHVKTLSPNESLVKRLKMIPLESVIRNIAAGSLCKRLGIRPNTQLNPPLYELFLKNDELHDPMVTEDHALSFHWATQPQLDKMRELTCTINQILRELFANADMILVDFKVEFGVDSEGDVCLGDEISPDSCRIWDSKTQEPLDKDRFRKDMGGVVDAYEEIAQRLGIKIPQTT
jgi:phosphoribosylaminoimidazole-succinocarboxamide synthase